MHCYTPDRRYTKSLPSTYVDQQSLETDISIAICRPTGDKWQSNTLFLAVLVRSSIVKSVFDCRLSGVCLQGLNRSLEKEIQYV